MKSLRALLFIEKFIDSGDVVMLQEGGHLRLKCESRALLDAIRENLHQIFQKEDDIYSISEIKGNSEVSYSIYLHRRSP